MMLVSTIEERLRDRCEAVLETYLPAARKNGDYYTAGDNGYRKGGGSFVVWIKGTKRGHWRDFLADTYGDMLDLIAITQKLTKGEAVREAKDWLLKNGGMQPHEDDFDRDRLKRPQIDPAEVARQQAAARERALAWQAEEAAQMVVRIRRAKGLWAYAKPIVGTPAEAYLRGRGFDVRGQDARKNGGWPGSFHFDDEVYFKPERVKIPALLMAVYTPQGQMRATHRIFLRRDAALGWTRVDHASAKAALGPIGGGFIPINRGASGKPMSAMPDGETVYMAEGAEKCMTIRMVKPESRIVCGINLGNMGAIVFPDSIGELVIAADRPKSPGELDLLEKVIAKHQSRGVKVRTQFSPPPYKDIDEWMLALLAQSRSEADAVRRHQSSAALTQDSRAAS